MKSVTTCRGWAYCGGPITGHTAGYRLTLLTCNAANLSVAAQRTAIVCAMCFGSYRVLSWTARLFISSVQRTHCRAMTATHLLSVRLKTGVAMVTVSSHSHFRNVIGCHASEIGNVCPMSDVKFNETEQYNVLKVLQKSTSPIQKQYNT